MSLSFFPAIPAECYGEAINEVESHSVENPLYDATLNGEEPEEGEPDKAAYKWTRSRRMTPRAIHGALVMPEPAQVFCHHHSVWVVKRVYTSPFPLWPVSFYTQTAIPAEHPTTRTEDNQYEFVATNLRRAVPSGAAPSDFFTSVEERAGTLPGYPSPHVEGTVANGWAYYNLIHLAGTSDPFDYPDFPATAETGRDQFGGDFYWWGFVEWREATQTKSMVRHPALAEAHTLQAEVIANPTVAAKAVPYCLHLEGGEAAVTDAGVVARCAFNKFGGSEIEDEWQAEGVAYAARVLGDGDMRLEGDLRQRGAFSIPLGHAPLPMFDLDSNRAINLVASSRGIVAQGDQFLTGITPAGVGVKIDIPLIEVFLGTHRANNAPTAPGAIIDARTYIDWPGIVRQAGFLPSHWFMPVGFSVEQALRLLPDVITGTIFTAGWTYTEGGTVFDVGTQVLYAIDRTFPTEPQYVLERRDDADHLAAATPPTGYEAALAFICDWLNAQIVACAPVGLVEVLDETPAGGTDEDREALSETPLYGLPALGEFGVQFRA